MIRPLSCSLLLLCVVPILWAYEVPRPRFRFYHQGFQVFVPHEDGVEFIRFAGEHRIVAGRKQALRLREFIKNNRYWTYRNYHTELVVGDSLKCWIYVRKNGVTHNKVLYVNVVEITEETTTAKPPAAADSEISQ